MTVLEAKRWLDTRYVLHPQYQPQPHHSSHALVNVGHTFMRVRHRMRKQQSTLGNRVWLEPSARSDNQLSDSSPLRAIPSNSFADAVEQTRQKLRLVHGRVA